jgi:TrmH family RNA methyltransferase
LEKGKGKYKTPPPNTQGRRPRGALEKGKYRERHTGSHGRERIESPRNPLIKSLAALARDGRERRARGECIIEGPHLVREALNACIPLTTILCTDDFPIRGESEFTGEARLIDEATGRGVRILQISEAALKRISTAVEPQGIIAVAEIPQTGFLAAEESARRLEESKEKAGSCVFVVGDSIKDPGNCGAIIRNCHALGAKGVILTGESTDPFSPKALRAAQGSTFHLPVLMKAQRTEVISFLERIGARIIVSDVAYGIAPSEMNPFGVLAVVLGDEAHGVSNQFRNAASESIRIPMPGGAQSLNVAVTSGIILYEILRHQI